MKPEKHWKPFDNTPQIDEEREFGKNFVKRLTEIFFDENE